jgi:hypothetical protein
MFHWCVCVKRGFEALWDPLNKSSHSKRVHNITGIFLRHSYYSYIHWWPNKNSSSWFSADSTVTSTYTEDKKVSKASVYGIFSSNTTYYFTVLITTADTCVLNWTLFASFYAPRIFGSPYSLGGLGNMLLQFKEYSQISTSKSHKPGKQKAQSPELWRHKDE